MPIVRAKENHPLFKKLQKIMDVCEAEGITLCEIRAIHHNDYGTWRITDLEDDIGNYSVDFPPVFEFKLTQNRGGD